MHDRGFRALVLECDERSPATRRSGAAAMPGRPRGEIYELYLRPECQGCGLGRRLFTEARRELAPHGLDRLMVWALAENEIACRFYRAMGGIEAGRSQDRFCGVPLDKIGFAWSYAALTLVDGAGQGADFARKAAGGEVRAACTTHARSDAQSMHQIRAGAGGRRRDACGAVPAVDGRNERDARRCRKSIRG